MSHNDTPSAQHATNMSEPTADDILNFWFEDIEYFRWFKSDPAFDRELEQRFGGLLKQARDNKLDHWCDTPQGHLALIIVLDQFSRNIHRGNAMAFDADPKALQLSLDGIEKSFDVELTPEHHYVRVAEETAEEGHDHQK